MVERAAPRAEKYRTRARIEAGMLGANVLDGTVRLWDARELDRVLAHTGFDSASLSGGALTLRALLGERAGKELAAP